MHVDYYVSGVWRIENKIESLLVHKNTPQGFTNGIKMSLREVTVLLQEGFTIHGIQWNYNNGKWIGLAPVDAVKQEDGSDYLHLLCTYTPIRLENLIDMSRIYDTTQRFPSLIKRRTTA